MDGPCTILHLRTSCVTRRRPGLERRRHNSEAILRTPWELIKQCARECREAEDDENFSPELKLFNRQIDRSADGYEYHWHVTAAGNDRAMSMCRWR
jgi:hypothetical protein